MKLNLTINGEKKSFEISINDTLMGVLRREGCHGVKHGCETGECGTCAVIMNGKAVASCIILAAQAEGAQILTVEGLGTPENLHPLQEAFLETGAVQCGYCTPGMLMASKALLDEAANPTEEDVKLALDGNLCRCTGYVKPVEAVLLAAERIRGTGA